MGVIWITLYSMKEETHPHFCTPGGLRPPDPPPPIRRPLRPPAIPLRARLRVYARMRVCARSREGTFLLYILFGGKVVKGNSIG